MKISRNTVSILLPLCVLPCAEAKQRPNIIVILADDLGYMDVGGFASRVTGTAPAQMFYQTPNIDAMMGESLCFSQAQVSQLSSPTRCALLTGRNPATVGFTTALPMRETWYHLGLTPPAGGYIHDVKEHYDNIPIQTAWLNAVSNSAIPAGTQYDNGRRVEIIPEIIKGYHSAFIGKWHVGGFGAEGYRPMDRGFTEAPAWFDAGGSLYFSWAGGWEQDIKARFPLSPQQKIVLGNPGGKPRCEYLTDDLTAKALEFIDRRAGQSEPFLLYFAHFAIHEPLQAKKSDEEIFERSPNKGWGGHANVQYASLVKSLDDSVGAILEKLRQKGIEENTVVIFLSDNGGIDAWVTPQRRGSNIWPYLGGKALLFEGGIKTPLIVRWKGKIEGGRWCDVAVDACDLLPTVMELSGDDPGRLYKKGGIDGRSWVPLFKDTESKRGKYSRREFYWHYPFNVAYLNPVDGLQLTPHSAVREGWLKLIFDWHGRLYLFDLKDDPYEHRNLAAQQPETTRRLFGKLVEWLERSVERQYWPVVNPKYDPQKEARKEVPFADLVRGYRMGKDVVGMAVVPDMSRLALPKVPEYPKQ